MNKKILLVGIVIILFVFAGILISLSNPEEYQKQLLPDKELKVVSIKQIRIDTIFTHFDKIRVGFLDDDKIRYVDFDFYSEGILYSNTTYIIRKNVRLWGSPFEHILYWNGKEI